ncbi:MULTISPECIES: hypothetical protein [unclassified Streptomyces]|uniref:hypothetical protein n=1 Tax=unclassified Streptomyces TaxID=2593676 RepID=UPI0033A5A1DD
MTSPERVAAAVVRAVDRPRREIVVGRAQRVGVRADRLPPGLYGRLVGSVVNAFAPRGAPVPRTTTASSAGLRRRPRAWQHSRAR